MAYHGKFEEGYRTARSSSPAPRSNPAPRSGSPAPRSNPVPKNRQTSLAREDSYTAKQPAKRGPRTSTVIFWTVWCLVIVGFFGGMFFLTDWLEGWLVSYEAAQPTTKCEELFQQLFADPDWADLYDRAGITDTKYEGRDAFVAYMEEKVGDQKLTYQETSAGLSGKKYFVKLGDEILGYFTMNGEKEYITDMPDWELGEISLNCRYDRSVVIQKMDGLTIFVNGVELTDEDTIQIGTTLAENYIPDNLHGPRIYTQSVTGLMSEPTITATDSIGNPVEVSYDEAQGLYIAQTASNTASEDEKTLALNTAKAYSLRMIEMNNKLSTYFDTSSDSYKTIVSIDPWMQEWFYSKHEFTDPTYTGYYRYSDKLFSIHVKLPMLVTRTDGTVKEYLVDHTFFFEKQGANWKCIIMSNVDVMQQVANVRLTFMSDDTVLLSEFFASDAKEITAPSLTVPEGKEFLGWFRESVDENGKKTMNLVFAPGEDSTITVAHGYTLEPMTLVALFGDAAESEGA